MMMKKKKKKKKEEEDDDDEEEEEEEEEEGKRASSNRVRTLSKVVSPLGAAVDLVDHDARQPAMHVRLLWE
jgi:hypothetical protein